MSRDNLARIEPDLYANLDRIAAEVIAPNAEENDRLGRFPRANLDALAEAGWTGVLTEPRYGGLGLSHLDRRGFGVERHQGEGGHVEGERPEDGVRPESDPDDTEELLGSGRARSRGKTDARW